MKTIPKTTLAAVCSAGLAVSTTSAGFINMKYVPVGDVGNPNDTVTASDGDGLHFGGVDHSYQIGKYKVTLTQYAAFLNAVAKSDPNDLYHTGMTTDMNTRGIARSSVSGSYTYTVIGDGGRPVTHVSMLDAMRFANWMHHGQPTGGQTEDTTEDGAYTLSLGGLARRNAGAIVFLPSESEWYKAAYYDPRQGGGKYWLYPTRSDDAPGNVIGPLPNQANYFTDLGSKVYSVTQSPTYDPSLNYLTPVGAYTSSASHYGTFDQGGNVWEWNEAVIGVTRGIRGNSWSIWREAKNLQSSCRGYSDPGYEVNYIGFRIACLPDTDGDGILDLFETGTGIYVSPADTGTNPTNPDSDNDGLNDGAEVFTYHSNPNLADTDGDSFLDGYELQTGHSMLDPLDKPALVAEARTAIEFTFPAALGKTYRIEGSTDLAAWVTVESGIAGTGGEIQRFYSTRNQPKRYFRVEEETP
jgi:formylglycine-generating enzyme required for sulfatase activity